MNRVFSSNNWTFRNAMRFHDFLISDLSASEFFKDETDLEDCRFDFLCLLWQVRRSKVVSKSKIVFKK